MFRKGKQEHESLAKNAKSAKIALRFLAGFARVFVNPISALLR
jgi:hypothetical protein